MPVYKAFVVMYGDKFCKFGSYRSARLVESPLKASLYSRYADVVKRLNERIWVGGEDSPVLPGTERLKIMEIQMSLEEIHAS